MGTILTNSCSEPLGVKHSVSKGNQILVIISFLVTQPNYVWLYNFLKRSL